MKFISILSLLAAGVVSAQNSTNSTVECADGLQMFISRGTGEEPGAGATGELAEAITQRIGGSKYLATDYPASFTEPVIYFESVGNGTAELRRTITQYTESCPDSKIAIFGYSQGAQATSNLLCGNPVIWGIPKPLPKEIIDNNIIAVVLFGDPTHQANATYNKGTADGSGIFYRADDSACQALGDRIISYCDTGDIFCDVGKDVNTTAHGVYINNYGTEVADFVVEQFEEASGPRGLNSSSTSSTSLPNPTDIPGTASSTTPIFGVILAASMLVLGLI